MMPNLGLPLSLFTLDGKHGKFFTPLANESQNMRKIVRCEALMFKYRDNICYGDCWAHRLKIICINTVSLRIMLIMSSTKQPPYS